MMEAMTNILDRMSYRAFKPEQIPEDVLRKVIEAAFNSPSCLNSQPWEVAVVTGMTRDKLSAELLRLAKANAPANPDIQMPGSWPEKMDQRKMEHGERRLKTIGVARDDSEGRERLRLMNYEFYGAPCAVFLFLNESLGQWSIFDMGLFTQNFILAAHARGLGSVIQASVTDYAPEIKRFLGLAENSQLFVCISIGYPDPDALLNKYRSVKKNPEEFVKWFD